MTDAAQPRRNARRLALGAILLCCVIGVTLVGVATSRGVGVTTDSVYYLLSARNLLDGHGLSRTLPDTGGYEPLVHWPPLYPLTLAAFGAAGSDMLAAARWLSAGLFAGTILVSGIMAKRMAAPVWLVFGAALVVALGIDMLKVHSMAWSEPPCIFLGLLGFLLLDMHLERPRRLLLAAAGASLACAVIVRYAGFAYLAVGGLFVVVAGRRPLRTRIADLAVFGVVAGALLGAMLLRNVVAGGSATARTFVFRLSGLPGELLSGLRTVTIWFLPQPIGLAIRGVLLGLLVAGALIWHLRLRRGAEARSEARPTTALPAMLATFIVAYLLLMVVTIIVIRPMPILDYRNLSPVYPAVVILAAWLVGRGTRATGGRRLLRVACVAAGCILLAAFSVRAVSLATTLKRTSVGFGQDIWQHSEVLQHVRELPPDRPIYTNAPDAIYYLTGRGSRRAPMNDREIEALRADLEKTRGVVVYCFNMRRAYLLPHEEVAKRLGLEVLVEASDGIIYQAGDEQPAR